MKLVNHDITFGHWDNKDEDQGRRKIECGLVIEDEGTKYDVHYEVIQFISFDIDNSSPEGKIINKVNEPEYEDCDLLIFKDDVSIPMFNTNISYDSVFELTEHLLEKD